MNKEQIASFCERYFAATGCELIEKTPVYLHVKLSPEADKELTGRTYYWNFVERTGAEPETMSFRFIFDPEAHERANSRPDGGESQQPRLYVLPPIAPQPGRTLEEPLVFGTRRLEQLYASACRKGACLQLFEELPESPGGSAGRSAGPAGGAAAGSVPYATWLGVNYKIAYVCDRKREELLSLGIHLSTGEIADRFFDRLIHRNLTPRMPPRTTLGETISLERAARQLEEVVLEHLNRQDYAWADEARRRLAEEEERIDAYYGDMLAPSGLSPEEREEIVKQQEQRLDEIRWQHEPRIEVCPVNYGLFHLLDDTFREQAVRRRRR
jgi:hypothetical protein